MNGAPTADSSRWNLCPRRPENHTRVPWWQSARCLKMKIHRLVHHALAGENVPYPETSFHRRRRWCPLATWQSEPTLLVPPIGCRWRGGRRRTTQTQPVECECRESPTRWWFWGSNSPLGAQFVDCTPRVASPNRAR